MNGCSVSMESYLPRVSRPGDEFRDETASFQGTKEKDKRQTYPKRIPQLLLFLILIGGGGFIRTYVAHDFHELFEADISISWKNKKKRNVSCTSTNVAPILFLGEFSFSFFFFFLPHYLTKWLPFISTPFIQNLSRFRVFCFYCFFLFFLTNNALYISYTYIFL